MFDNQQPKNSGSTPNNLPMGEPEDILAGADDSVLPDPGLGPQADTVTPPEPASSSALGAGVLRPKMAPISPAEDLPLPDPGTAPQPLSAPAGADNVPMAPMDADMVQPPVNNQFAPTPGRPDMTTPPPGMAGAPGADDMYQLKEPIGSRKTILWIIIAIIVLVLGVGSVWIYMSFMRDGGNDGNGFDVPITDDTDLDNIDNQGQPVDSDTDDSIKLPDSSEVVEDPSSTIDLEDRILFGEPIDTDGDDLDDVREADLKTDPLNWDTDGDGLGDGAEVNIWKTDPLNIDTDGDTYLDGAEIKNGYSPTGPGKLFELPTSTEDVT